MFNILIFCIKSTVIRNNMVGNNYNVFIILKLSIFCYSQLFVKNRQFKWHYSNQYKTSFFLKCMFLLLMTALN